MTISYELPGRKHQFYFYATGPGGNSTVVEAVTPPREFALEDVRIVMGTSHVSIVDVACRLSSILDSGYNVTFFSQAMLGLSNYFWQPSQPLYCLSGDQIILSLIVSAANLWGFYVSGWAVMEPSNRS